MLKNSKTEFTPVSNIFIDKYMTVARGEFVKVYILLLKCTTTGEPGVTSDIIAAKLGLLESEVTNALKYWSNEGVIKLVPLDKMNNFEVEFIDLSRVESTENEKVNLLSALEKNSNKDMLKDIELLLNRPLSNKEIEMYLSWTQELGFSLELILYLIEYCVSKEKRTANYIESVALAWDDSGIKSIEDANEYMANFEDKWVKIRTILKYLNMQKNDLMKTQQDAIEKWLFTYNFPMEVILKACDICSKNLNKANINYIDKILSNWFEQNLKTLKDINAIESNYKAKLNNQKKPIKTSNKFMKFTNYSQREYDYESLEDELLGWDE